MRYLRILAKLSLLFVLLVIGILAGIDNSEPVSLRFLDWHTPQASVFAWVLGALILGILVGMALSTGVNLRSTWRARSARRQLELTEREVQQLKVEEDQSKPVDSPPSGLPDQQAQR